MDILKIIGIAISGAVSALVLKENKPALALCITIVTVFVIFSLMISEINYVFDVIRMVTDRLSIQNSYLSLIIRIIGIAYLAQLGSSLCRDAGQNVIAQKIEMAGKIMIVTASIPILTSVLNLIIGILP